MKKNLSIITLGCRANQLESSIILDDFIANNWKTVNFDEKVDLYVINTCAVTEKSVFSCISTIKKAKKNNPESILVVTGCWAQLESEKISMMPEVDLIVGNLEKKDLYKLVQTRLDEKVIVSDVMQQDFFDDKKVFSSSGKARANIKIQDGCNYRCTYCIIPFARGKSRSNKLSNVIEQINILVDRNYDEIVLTGIHLGQWGLDFKPKDSVVTLLKALEKIEGLHRYRLGSLDPREITDEFIDVISSSKKFCRHLHISLQSTNNTILKAMKRPYTVEYCLDLFEKLKKNIPYLAIGSDIITGFPGETEDMYFDGFNNIKKIPVDYLHVFPYSRRKGTVADSMPNHIAGNVKKERAKKLRIIALNKNIEYKSNLLNKDFEVIVENSRDKKTNLLKGLTDNYVTVLFEGKDDCFGKTITLTITKNEGDKTFGVIL